jgi:hypothetical protein
MRTTLGLLSLVVAVTAQPGGADSVTYNGPTEATTTLTSWSGGENNDVILRSARADYERIEADSTGLTYGIHCNDANGNPGVEADCTRDGGECNYGSFVWAGQCTWSSVDDAKAGCSAWAECGGVFCGGWYGGKCLSRTAAEMLRSIPIGNAQEGSYSLVKLATSTTAPDSGVTTTTIATATQKFGSELGQNQSDANKTDINDVRPDATNKTDIDALIDVTEADEDVVLSGAAAGAVSLTVLVATTAWLV